MSNVNVHVRIEPLKRFSAAVRRGLRTPEGPVRDAFTQWQALYVGYIRQRFVQLSRSGGGGDWPKLAESTINRRRHGHGGRFRRGSRARARAVATGGGQVAILRDTGILLGTLEPMLGSTPGKVARHIPYGIQAGIGGPSRHPRGKATIADIAVMHHRGGKNLPQRKILVDPPRAVIARMQQVLDAAITRLTQGG